MIDIIKFIISLIRGFLSGGSLEKNAGREVIRDDAQRDLAEFAAKRKRLQDALKYAVNLPYYKKGYEKWSDGTPKTFCNVLARKFLTGTFDYGLYDNRVDPQWSWLNYDISPVFGQDMGKAFYGYSCKDAWYMAEVAVEKKEIVELDPENAQLMANIGQVVWVVGYKERTYSHEAIVYPNNQGYDSEKGPKIAQAGGVNLADIHVSHPYAWGKYWKEVKYYAFPEKTDG